MNFYNRVIFISLSFFMLCCGSNDLRKKAQKEADFLMNHLSEPGIDSLLSEKYFPPTQTDKLLSQLRGRCDYENREGQFVDYFYQQNIGGTDQVSFIYEFYLACDSLRFIASYKLENDPVLYGLKIEQLEKENSMIINTDRQLLNR